MRVPVSTKHQQHSYGGNQFFPNNTQSVVINPKNSGYASGISLDKSAGPPSNRRAKAGNSGSKK